MILDLDLALARPNWLTLSQKSESQSLRRSLNRNLNRNGRFSIKASITAATKVRKKERNCQPIGLLILTQLRFLGPLLVFCPATARVPARMLWA